MWKHLLVAVLGLVGAGANAADDAATAVEQRWVDAGRPVLAYARRLKLPLDVIVQPEASSGQAPLAMAYIDGRCKLVLTMRGNPQAEAALEGVAPALVPAIIEVMIAHEIGHCWRYARGAWHTLPAGFVDAPNTRADDERELVVKRRDMRQTRREEGFADLVALAWAQAQYPEHYARIHAWFEQVRNDGPGEHHDTRAWLRLVRNPAAFGDAATPFDQVRALWREGLLDED
jgi:hypothetical protein